MIAIVSFRSQAWVTVLPLLFSVVLLRAAAPSEPPPVRADEAGKKAWALLGTHYRAENGSGDSLNTAVDAALRDLEGTDTAKAQTASVLLLALFRQALADEGNGRAVWQRTPWWGGGSESIARDFRKSLASRFGKTASSGAAVPVAQWLLFEDRLIESQHAAIATIDRCLTPAGDALIRSILANGTHSRPAIVMALNQAAKRKLRDKPDVIRNWARDARATIRTAAADALKALEAGRVPEFKPEDAFDAAIQKLLTNFLTLLPDSPDLKAEFGHVEISNTGEDGKTHSSRVTGWLRSQQGDVLLVTTWHGASVELQSDPASKRTVDFKPADAKASVGLIRGLRESKDKEAGRKLQEALSSGGGFTGQFESQLMTAPEDLLAAWLYQKGEKAAAAALLFPLLDRMDDDRWPLEIVRDLVARRCHQEMLDAFSYQRDYSGAKRMAQHLGRPVFDGYNYQPRAKELAAQLEKRAEDFKSFTLPSTDEWKRTAATMPRDRQVEFLAARLRLLNCFQASQPGDVDYSDPQFAEPGPHWGGEKAGKQPTPVINPFNELRQLKLRPADLPALAPFLEDDNYLPTYSYWRSFHPDRTLHRVNWLVAELVNGAAMRAVIDLADWQDLPPEERGRRVQSVLAFAREMAGKSTAEIIKANMDRAENEREWFRAASEAALSKEANLLPSLLAGAEKYPEKKAAIAQLCFHLGSPEAAGSARLWIKLKDNHLQLYAALILLRHGTPDEKTNALATLKLVMAAPWDEGPLDALDPMLSLDDPLVTEIACAILRRPEFDWGYSDWTAAHRLFLTKHPAALAALIEALESTTKPRERAGEWQGQKVKRKLTRGDEAAAALARIRKEYEYPQYAPDNERAAARKSFGEWLKNQHALLKSGEPTPELEMREWHSSKPQIDAP